MQIQVRGPRGHLHRVRVLLGLLGLVGRARAAVRREMTERLGLGGRASSSSSPRTMVISASTSRRSRARRRACGERRGGGGGAWRADDHRVLRNRAGNTHGGGAGGHADLVLGNNVLAQVPDINDFVAGVAALLGPEGRLRSSSRTSPKLIEHLEYDTIYHEHFSYFSLHAIRSIFGAQGLELVDVEELPSHGGSLRVFLQHAEAGVAPASAVAELLAREDEQGMRDHETYRRFADGVRESKPSAPRSAHRPPEAGEAGRGLRRHRQGTRCSTTAGSARTSSTTPSNGTRTSRASTHRVPTSRSIRRSRSRTKPDVILILPWNIAREISEQLAYTAEWGAKLMSAVRSRRCSHRRDSRGRSPR